jgi:hypothetical protein
MGYIAQRSVEVMNAKHEVFHPKPTTKFRVFVTTEKPIA